RYLQMADEASKSLLSLINDILDFSKIEAGKLELESIEFDLIELVEETLGLFVKRASDLGIELASFISKSVPRRIVSDPGKLRQVLLNLLSNALKFTTQGGILVCVEMGNKDRLKIQVIDTGIGIEEEKIEKLFDQFVQVDSSTNRKYGGTGLGLAISSRLANLLGGEMDVQSIHSIGSQFWFTIKPEITENIAAIERPVIKASRAKLYESNPIALCALTRQLDEMGLEIETNPLSEGQSPTIEFFNEETSWKYDLVDRVVPATTEGTCLRKPVKTDDLLKAVQGKKLSAENQKQDDNVITVHSVTGRRLLLAEDSQANQIIAITFLKSAGYRVDAVANGQEALDAVMSLPYDLVLMDVSMPEMDGLEATRRIRELPGDKGQIKIIALTANVFKDDLDRCMEAGMNGFIPKPIDKNNLLTTLAKFLPEKPVQDTKVVSTEIIQDASCLDMDVLGQLIDDVDEEIIPIMMQVYFKEVDNRCREIEKALSSNNLEVLQEEAHALKSSSGALGANGLCGIAEKLELACKEGRVEDALAFANALNGIAHECMGALSGYFKLMPVDE
ncbi:MAG: response regulator, partial [Gammaproteobacteria bacterium]